SGCSFFSVKKAAMYGASSQRPAEATCNRTPNLAAWSVSGSAPEYSDSAFRQAPGHGCAPRPGSAARVAAERLEGTERLRAPSLPDDVGPICQHDPKSHRAPSMGCKERCRLGGSC